MLFTMKLKIDPTFQFEKRKYTEDASLEEITAIKNTVYLYNSQIIYFKDLPVVSSFSTNITFDQIELLAKNIGPCGLLLDVSESAKPDASTRRTLTNRQKKLPDNIRHLAFVTKSNIIVRTFIKFVMFQSVLKSYSVNSAIEEALSSINKKLND